jgi:hypothetical protein
MSSKSPVVSVGALSDSMTISLPTLAAQTNVTIGIGQSATFADPAFSTGDVFTRASGEQRRRRVVPGVATPTSAGACWWALRM